MEASAPHNSPASRAMTVATLIFADTALRKVFYPYFKFPIILSKHEISVKQTFKFAQKWNGLETNDHYFKNISKV